MLTFLNKGLHLFYDCCSQNLVYFIINYLLQNAKTLFIIKVTQILPEVLSRGKFQENMKIDYMEESFIRNLDVDYCEFKRMEEKNKRPRTRFTNAQIKVNL